MTTAPNSAILDPVTNPVPTVAPQSKEDTTMSGATNKITALYCRLSQEDARLGESLSIENQELICKGWFLPPNTYDCGSFVVNETAVVGKEQKGLITAGNQHKRS